MWVGRPELSKIVNHTLKNREFLLPGYFQTETLAFSCIWIETLVPPGS